MARVHRLLKKLLDGRAGSKRARGDIPSPFYRGPLSCRNYNCYRHYRMRYAHDAFGVDAEIPPHCLSRASRFDRKRQSDRKNIHTSLRNVPTGKIWRGGEGYREQVPVYREDPRGST